MGGMLVLNFISTIKEGSTSEQGAKVFVEMDGIGHAYIEVNRAFFSYGRYDGTYSPATVRFGIDGPEAMLCFKGR
jgi:hypothetical protein